MVEVVFPGKEFMIEKYGLQSKEQRAKIKDGKKGEVSSSELRVTSKKKVSSSELLISSQNSVLKTQNWKLKYWWLWYGYRWWVALRAVFSGKW